MALTALALLRVQAAPALDLARVPALGPARLTALDDGFLLDTGAPFSTDPDQLSALVQELVGTELARAHFDPRGLFFIPSVAAPAARSYEGVIAEVAEGGVWGPAPAEASPLMAAMAGGGLGALLGTLMQQLPDGMLDSVGAAARGQPGAFEAATSQLRAAADSGGLDLNQLGAMLEGSGIDLNAMQQLASQMQAVLARDPAAAAAFAERLFAGEHDESDEDDENDG